MPLPTENAIKEIVTELGKHRLSPLGGAWECECGKAHYGPRQRRRDQADEVKDQHDFHVARALIQAGLTVQSRDPRENFLRRIESEGTADGS